MKLSQYKADYYALSGKASDVARQLSLAGVALIWVFKLEGKPYPKIPDQLLFPSALLVMALGADLFHYVSATIIWGWFHRHNEKKLRDKTEDPDLTAPRYLNWPAQTFFVVKLSSVVLAYMFMGIYLWSIWFQHIRA